MAGDNGIMSTEFERLQTMGEFHVRPYEGPSLENNDMLKKLELSPAKKKHISAMMQQFPSAMATGTMVNAYTVSFPEGLPHTLIELKQGGYGSMIPENGKFVGSASFYEMKTQATFLGIFTAMSVASGQYFLAQINSELTKLNAKLDNILKFLYGDKKAELLSEISFTKYAYENYESIMACEQQRLATAVNLQQAKKVAIKDMEFYLNDLADKTDPKKRIFFKSKKDDECLKEICRVRESLELSMQLYVMSTLLEIQYVQNLDKAYIDWIKNDIDDYLDKCEKRISNSFSEMKKAVKDKTAIEECEEWINFYGEKTILRKSVSEVLMQFMQKPEYYLTTDGEVYISIA